MSAQSDAGRWRIRSQSGSRCADGPNARRKVQAGEQAPWCLVRQATALSYLAPYLLAKASVAAEPRCGSAVREAGSGCRRSRREEREASLGARPEGTVCGYLTALRQRSLQLKAEICRPRSPRAWATQVSAAFRQRATPPVPPSALNASLRLPHAGMALQVIPDAQL